MSNFKKLSSHDSSCLRIANSVFSIKMVALLLLFILLCGGVFGQSPRYKIRTSRVKNPNAAGSVLYKYKPTSYVQADETSVLTEYESKIKNIVEAAANFLLDVRHADYGWDSPVSTSRAIVALAFADKVRQLPESEWQLMKKQLNLQLSLDLLETPMKTSLSHLALYINALYATCQDPRSFQGLNLVRHLRSETDKAMLKKFSLPIALLTLCVSGETDPMDLQQLCKIYSSSNETSTRALTLIAWDCMRRKRDYNPSTKFNYPCVEFSLQLKNFISQTDDLTHGYLDVYSTALYFQASNQAELLGRNVSPLISHMKPDGSFGDLLSTYFAIPALLNATLLDLRCDVIKDEWTENAFNMHSGGKNVTYSLWIPTDTYVNTRTITVNYGDQATFYDVMRMAEFKDPTYTFKYDIDAQNNTKIIYSLADTPNDPESGKYWTLYKTNKDIVVNSQKNLHELPLGVDVINPEYGAHYIFWLKRRQFRSMD